MRPDVLPRDEDFPNVTVLRESRPKASKQYRCTFCNAPIRVGERHDLFVYLDHEALGSQFRCSRIHVFCPPYDEEQSQ